MAVDSIVSLLEEYAEYLELDGQDGRAHAYQNAANSIRRKGWMPPDPSDIHGIGDSIRTTIARYQVSGQIDELESLKEKYPYFEELRNVKYIGPSRAQTLHEKFNVEDIDDLLLVGTDITLLTGVGPKTADKILDSAEELRDDT